VKVEPPVIATLQFALWPMPRSRKLRLIEMWVRWHAPRGQSAGCFTCDEPEDGSRRELQLGLAAFQGLQEQIA
jgi:hypothetical protein